METLINKISRQFLAGVSLKHFDWQMDNFNLFNAEMQQQLLNATVCHSLTKIFNLSQDYKRTFLKFVINQLESSGTELLDQFYEEYTELLIHQRDSSNARCDRIYVVDDDLQIVIRESSAIISKGTTGLVTWPAAKALAEFCLENGELFRDRNVIELGCGLGLTGLVVCKRLRPRNFVFTDYHAAVVDTLQENLYVNFSPEAFIVGKHLQIPADCDDECYQYQWDTTTIEVVPFHWHDTLQLRVLRDWSPPPEIVLAADVVYDVNSIPLLLKTVATLLSRTSIAPFEDGHLPIRRGIAFVAVTERNSETVKTFFRHAEIHNLTCEEQQPLTKQVFFYDRSCPIRVMKLCLPQSNCPVDVLLAAAVQTML